MSLVITQGLGQNRVYLMRAYHTSSPIGYVYWEVDTPDTTGAFAPYPANTLTNIITARSFVV